MQPDPQVISAVFTGLLGLLGAVTGLVTARTRRAAVDRREHRALQRRHVIALRHIFTLELDLAAHGHDPPPRPRELDEDDEPATGPRLPPAPSPDPGGRHGAS